MTVPVSCRLFSCIVCIEALLVISDNDVCMLLDSEWFLCFLGFHSNTWNKISS